MNEHMTERQKRTWLALIIVGILLALALALTDRAEAAPVTTTSALTCPRGSTPVYVCRYTRICAFGICRSVCTGYNIYCRYKTGFAPGRTSGLAAPMPGNRGGCSPESRVIGLACTVQDAGVGWVSGTCVWGEYFLAQTARTFLPGQPVNVSGCVNQHGVITSAPGAPLRVSRR